MLGPADGPHQKKADEEDLRSLPGTAEVIDLPAIKTRVHPADVKVEIIAALKRFAEANAERVRVSVLDEGKVTLEGRVHSWDEREVIYKAVSSIPGVQSVNDQLTLS